MNNNNKMLKNKLEFKYLEHTADIKFIAFGKTLSEAFRNSGRAMINSMTDVKKIKKKVKKKMCLKADGLKALLFDFLTNIIYEFEVNNFIFCTMQDVKLVNEKEEIFSFTSTLIGDIYRKKNYEFITSIKSVTYNDMLIKKVNGVFQIQVVIDH